MKNLADLAVLADKCPTMAQTNAKLLKFTVRYILPVSITIRYLLNYFLFFCLTQLGCTGINFYNFLSDGRGSLSYRERRREAHTAAEQKRRDAIKKGCDATFFMGHAENIRIFSSVFPFQFQCCGAFGYFYRAALRLQLIVYSKYFIPPRLSVLCYSSLTVCTYFFSSLSFVGIFLNEKLDSKQLNFYVFARHITNTRDMTRCRPWCPPASRRIPTVTR